MRRQMQLRPSQGGKMRGPVDNRPCFRDSLLEWEDGVRLDAVVRDGACRCGYLVCAKVGPCAPVGPELVAEPEPEPLRYADGQEVRVGDVYVLDPDDQDPWAFEVARISNGLLWFVDGGGELGPIAREEMSLRHLRRRRAAPRIEVGMRVRVKDDATAPSSHRRSMWAGNTGVVTGMYEEGFAQIDYSKRVRREYLEPIE